MNAQPLIDTARALVSGDKGILAMDESSPTANKRFAKLGIPRDRGGKTRLSGIDCDHAGSGCQQQEPDHVVGIIPAFARSIAHNLCRLCFL